MLAEASRLEAEFERDGIVQHLRKLGHEGPTPRRLYLVQLGGLLDPPLDCRA
jgi:hypothetical protein